ncbi:MAG: hypothetical protein Q7T56_10170 [Nocardioidaceae bacterium]|nr:hypothetical protein [Nocardioidaceae bacterium]
MSSILFVCTGNVCRSPLAELLLRSRLDDAGLSGIRVASAGTDAPVGAEMDPLTQEVAADMGLDGSVHRARMLDRAMLEDADLVLTAARLQRKSAVQLLPRAVRYSFTLLQASQLLSVESEEAPVTPDLNPGRRRTVANQVTAVRDHMVRNRGALTGGTDLTGDIDDPFGGDISLHRRVALEIAESVDVLAVALLETEQVSER